MCQPRARQKSFGAWGCNCGRGSVMFFRRFMSKKEKKEMLEEYKDQLKKELAGVEEHIQKFKNK